MQLKINKAEKIKGTVSVPGDKSISHRALIFASLAKGRTKISNFLTAADCLSTLQCLRRLGVEIKLDGTEAQVKGVGLWGLSEPTDVLDVGNSGTTLRILPGVLAGQKFFSVLTGDESVRSRPMDRIIQPLTQMGAKIWGRQQNGRAPLAIQGNSLKGITYKLPVASAQVKTALLLAGLLAEGETTVIESHPSRDHTERLFAYLEIESERKIQGDERIIKVKGEKAFSSKDLYVPCDFSSAAFFIAAALVVKNSEIILEDVGLNPTRTGFLDVLTMMGAQTEFLDEKVIAEELVGTLRVSSKNLKSTEIGGALIPRIIDELLILAVIATQAEGTTIVKDARELRVKETDRIKAIVSELRKMGAKIEEREDGFTVEGPTALTGALCESYGDHRLAMSLAIAGLAASGETVIKDADCISVSYPHFEETLKSLVE